MELGQFHDQVYGDEYDKEVEEDADQFDDDKGAEKDVLEIGEGDRDVPAGVVVDGNDHFLLEENVEDRTLCSHRGLCL